jgi:hypothetical protein
MPPAATCQQSEMAAAPLGDQLRKEERQLSIANGKFRLPSIPSRLHNETNTQYDEQLVSMHCEVTSRL